MADGAHRAGRRGILGPVGSPAQAGLPANGGAWRAAASTWLLVVALSGAALAVGTVHTVTLCVVSSVLAVSAILAWWDADPASMRQPATVLVVTGVVLTAYSALQCLPLPIAWLRVLAPHNADVWSRALAPLHEGGPRWAPISLDPTATRIEVLKGVAYLLAFVTALRVARRRRGGALLGGTLVATGVVLALAALLHPAFGAHKLYGLWEPANDYDRHLAPFLNPNNLASYINVAFCLSLAALLAPEPRIPRPILASVVLILTATQIWVASRGGVATMLLGAALVVAILRAGRMRGRQSVAIASLVASVAIAAGTFMIVLGGSEQASSELIDTDTSKLDFFGETMRMLPSYPIFGVGRGAFGTAFPAFQHIAGYVTFVYPENVVAQWILEWGAPLGALGLAAMAYGLRPNAVLVRSTTAAGAWAAIVAVAVQNLVDLGSEIPGLVLALVLCGAIVVGGSAGRAPRWSLEKWARAPRAVAMACAVCALFAIAGAATSIGREVDDDRIALQHAASDPHVPRDSMRALAREAMARHPAEPYLPFAGALRAVQAKDDDAMDWIEATLERASVYGPAHLLLARFIAARSPSQARLEYRLAMEQAPELAGVAMTEAPHWIRGYDDAMELVPEGHRGVPVLEGLAQSLQARLPATSVELDEEHARRAPTDAGPALRRAAAAVDNLEAGESAPWCDPATHEPCLKDALDAARLAMQLAPTTCEAYALRARAQAASGNAVVAVRELSEASDRVTDRVVCLQALAVLAHRAHDETHASEAMARIANAGCAQDAECAGNLAWVAALEEQRGNPQRARVLYKQAYERAPEEDGLLESIARLAASGGLHAEAADDYAQLGRRHPDDARWSKAVNVERDAALRAAMQL